MTFNISWYTVVFAAWLLVNVGYMLFEFGESRPGYIVDGGLIATLVLHFTVIFLAGYMAGKDGRK